ncbi:hypothetical protein AAHE18_09G004800 [Arachis hypogaea]
MNVTLFLPLAISTFLFIIVSISSASSDTPLIYTNGQQAQQLGKLNGSIDDEGKRSLNEKVNEKNVSKLHIVSKKGGRGRGRGGDGERGGGGSGGSTWIIVVSHEKDDENSAPSSSLLSVSKFWILLLIIFVSLDITTLFPFY